MTDVMFSGVDERMPVVLRKMQQTGQRLTIVVDDDSRTVGLVTIEDIVAELVGEITDDRAVTDPAGVDGA